MLLYWWKVTLGWVGSAVMTSLNGEGGSLLVLEFSSLLHWSFPPGEGCGGEREEDYTRRQKNWDLMRWGHQLLHRTLQHRRGLCQEPSTGEGFQPWYSLVTVNVLELGRALAHVDGVWFCSVLLMCLLVIHLLLPDALPFNFFLGRWDQSSVFKQKWWVSKGLLPVVEDSL